MNLAPGSQESTQFCSAAQNERAALPAALVERNGGLESRLDFESPSFQQGFWNVLGVLVLARPLAQASGADVLIGLEFEFLHHLLEFGDGGNDWPDRLRFAPIRIAASLCHWLIVYLPSELRF